MSPTADPPFRAIADSTYDWETWVDAAGTVRWTNPAVERFTGYSASECLALPGFPLSVVDEADRERIALVLEDAANGASGNDIEFRVLHRDGSSHWAAISFQPLVDEDGKPRGYRTSVRDIALRKRWEVEIRESERASARAAAERADLLATLSHELRSPLHCIAGFAELLLRTEQSPEARKFLGYIDSQAAGALRLVEDLLRFASDLGREEPVRDLPFDLVASVSAEVEAIRARANEGVSVELDDRLGAARARRGDADRVRQIVANLLGNAIRFTERGRVVIRLSPDGEGVRIVVSDTGVGMSEATLARAREPFFQSTPSRTSRGGVGLGLAIVDALATRLGGSVELASREGVGTTATVRLPLPRGEGLPDARGGVVEGLEPIPDLDVLVVDDVAAARELTVAMLASFGLEARAAASGALAIDECRRAMPDLVLLDLHMPGIDGIATAAAIRALRREADPSDAKPRIVVLTANVLASRDSSDVDAWVTKPLRRSALGRLLREASADRAGRSGPEPEDDVLAELERVRGPDGRSLLARRGPALVEALREAIARATGVETPAERSRAAHEVRGLAATLGMREVVERASALEHAGPDAEALASALWRSFDERVAAIEERIAHAT